MATARHVMRPLHLVVIVSSILGVPCAWGGEAAALKMAQRFPESASQYQPIECKFALEPTPTNPWDPAAIGISAEVRSPSGRTLTVHPFYAQDYEVRSRPETTLSPVLLFRAYVAPSDWPDAKKLTLFIDDVKLVDKKTGETAMLGGFEDGAEGWSPGDASAEKAHSGQRSLEVDIDLSQKWPGANLRPPIANWSRFKEVRFAVFPKTDGTKGTLSVEFWQDMKKQIKLQTQFSTASQALKLNQWNELVWDLSAIPVRRELIPVGKPQFRFRIALLEPGEHEVRFISKGNVLGKHVVRCVPASGPKLARVSPVNRRYFETADGQSLFLIGENSSFPHNTRSLAGYEAIFPELRKVGCNYVRFWVGPGQCLEPEKLGEYPLDRCFLQDEVLSLAMKNGLYCLFCVQFAGDLSMKYGGFWDFMCAWDKNPYNAALGGPCQKPLDFMTNAQAKALYRQRLRYIAARYGAYLNILAWQFWNEVDGAYRRSEEATARWHAEMADYLRGIDPYKHLITTSFSGSQTGRGVWALPQMELIQTHSYNQRDKAQEAHDLIGFWSEYDKPYFLGEVGIHGRGGHLTAALDPKGLHLHNAFWASLASGAAGTPMTWWWDSYVHKLGLYHHFTPIAQFVKGIPFSRKVWKKAKVSSPRYVGKRTKVNCYDLTVAPSAGFDKAKESVFVVSRDGTVSHAQCLSKLLHATGGHADKRNPPTFEVDYLGPGKFTVHVKTVSQRAVLEIHLDGKLALAKELPAGKGLGKESQWDETWKVWYTTYDVDLSIDVPAGKHRIKVDNTGRDWANLSNYVFGNYETDETPRLHVWGLASDSVVILWVHNVANTWLNRHAGQALTPVEPTRFALEGLRDGAYRVEHWDTSKGMITDVKTVSVTHGRVQIEVPVMFTDMALKIVKLRATQ